MDSREPVALSDNEWARDRLLRLEAAADGLDHALLMADGVFATSDTVREAVEASYPFQDSFDEVRLAITAWVEAALGHCDREVHASLRTADASGASLAEKVDTFANAFVWLALDRPQAQGAVIERMRESASYPFDRPMIDLADEVVAWSSHVRQTAQPQAS
jgi:hypothetical protein